MAPQRVQNLHVSSIPSLCVLKTPLRLTRGLCHNSWSTSVSQNHSLVSLSSKQNHSLNTVQGSDWTVKSTIQFSAEMGNFPFWCDAENWAGVEGLTLDSFAMRSWWRWDGNFQVLKGFFFCTWLQMSYASSSWIILQEVTLPTALQEKGLISQLISGLFFIAGGQGCRASASAMVFISSELLLQLKYCWNIVFLVHRFFP